MLRVVIVCLLLSASVRGQEKVLFGALGDSGTVGLSAETGLVFGAQRFCASQVLKAGVTLSMLTLAQLGFAINGNRYRRSWATGSNLASYAARVGAQVKAEGRHLVVQNFAQIGAKMDGMLQQADHLIQYHYREKTDSLGYVAILTPVNDVIRMKDEHDLPSSDAVIGTYTKLLMKFANLEQPDPVRIVILPLFNLADIGYVDQNRARILPYTSAATFRALFRPFLYWSSWKSREEYDVRVEQLKAINRSIQMAVDNVSGRVSARNLEVAFLCDLFDTNLTGEFLAADACHPSQAAHARMASDAWRLSPWRIPQ